MYVLVDVSAQMSIIKQKKQKQKERNKQHMQLQVEISQMSSRPPHNNPPNNNSTLAGTPADSVTTDCLKKCESSFNAYIFHNSDKY